MIINNIFHFTKVSTLINLTRKYRYIIMKVFVGSFKGFMPTSSLLGTNRLQLMLCLSSFKYILPTRQFSALEKYLS